MNKLKCGVVGVGYLGGFHAEKYRKLKDAELIAVCDSDPGRAKKIGKKLKTVYCTDYQELADKVDAVSIAVPTQQHFEVAQFFIENGVHVLLEKPITTTIEEANTLITLAKQHNVTLQVGHLERFNQACLAIMDKLDNPLFIESHRLSPFKPRGTDVNVVLDLMIHDIDIISSIVKSPIARIDASGAPVLSNRVVDIANARINFENGCVANVTASRVSIKSERKLRIFQPNAYISLDFNKKQYAYYQKGQGEMFPGIPDIIHETSSYPEGDALNEEIKSFVNAVRMGLPPVVSGEDGKKALETALEITKVLSESPVLKSYHPEPVI